MKKQTKSQKPVNQKTFVPGVFVRKTKFGFGLSIEYADFIKFFNEHGSVSEKNSKTYLNIDVNESQKGNAYASLNNWQPSQKA